MKFTLALLLGSLPLAISTATTTVTICIPPSQGVPNPGVLSSSTRATLTSRGSLQAAPLTTANTFVFANMTEGSYLLDVHCATHAFAPLRVDVHGRAESPDRLAVTAWETFRGNDWDNKGAAATRRPADGAFELKVLGLKEYYMERSGFSVFGILKNPMILMALVTMGIFLGMPKLLENMDPEMRAEFESRQKGSTMNAMLGAAGGPQTTSGPIANFDMAAFLAGSNSNNKKDDGGNGGSSAPAPPSSGGSGNGGGKKGGRR